MRTAHPAVFECDECGFVGRTDAEIAFHASISGHAAFVCKTTGCERTFSRLDTYHRHERSHNSNSKRYPCQYCKKYRGRHGFKRKDHLTQHIRKYHHIGEGEAVGSVLDRKWCPKPDCSEARASHAWYERAFATSAEWLKHMREVHNECKFPCPKSGCDRINAKGYFRVADLRTHLRKVHGMTGDL